MKHHANSTLLEAHRRRGLGVDHLLDYLHLQEVVARAETSELVATSIPGAVGHVFRRSVL